MGGGGNIFNIDINDLFFELEDLNNFADDNTIDAAKSSIEEVIYKLEDDLKIVLDWLKINGFVANPKKFQFMILGLKKPHKLGLDINSTMIKSVKSVKLLGVIIDDILSFKGHVSKMCSKAKNSYSALRRIKYFTFNENMSLLINSSFTSNFNYCPLIWMFCGKLPNQEIENIHRKALKLVSNNTNATYEELLLENGSISIHKRNLQLLMIEIYSCYNKMNPSFLWGLIEPKNMSDRSLRSNFLLNLPKTKTESFGIRSISFRGSILWNYLPDYIKSSPNIGTFKTSIKDWTGDQCLCHICRL